MGFGKVLRTLRTTAGLSLREVARELDVSPTYLSLVETGKSPPPVEDKVRQLEVQLGVPPGSLLSFTKRYPSHVSDLLQENPEVVKFLEAAYEKAFSPDDFALLARVMSKGGRQILVEALDQAWKEICLLHPEITLADTPFLGKNFIFTTFKARDRNYLIQHAASLMAEIPPGCDAKRVMEALLDREASGSTALGDGLALPHAFLEGLEHRIMALIKIPEGVDFGAADKKPVTLALFIVSPEEAKAYHIYLLARIARFFLQPGFHQRLLEANELEEVVQLFDEMDEKTP
jgi:PTS system nitrogen regulatory IIA component